MFLLDTNVVSELRLIQDGLADARVTAWAAGQDPTTFYISVMTVLEAEVGIQRMERRDPAQGRLLRNWWVSTILPLHSARFLDVDERVVALAATFHVPNPAPVADSLIAATALVHGLTVATRNVRDFAFPGVRVLNPWDAVA